VSQHYESNLDSDPEAHAYCTQERGLSLESIQKFRIGYSCSIEATRRYLELSDAPVEHAVQAGLLCMGRDYSYDRMQGRITTPIFDLSGNVIGFSGRVLQHTHGDSAPKYMNTADSYVYKKSLSFFGMPFALEPMRKLGYAVLVEGNFDVVTMHQVGFENTVAACGTAVTQEQLTILQFFVPKVILWLDEDKAGVKAAERTVEACKKIGMQYELMPKFGVKDPDEYLRTYGAEALTEFLPSLENV
jgi:DNA primase